jgi:hypothetical protein
MDIIEGSAVPGKAGLYVLGCYDDRITFFSQQARALNLIWALSDQGYLSNVNRIAIVGGGAAGVTAAAAISLLREEVVVELFESRIEILELQSISTKRSLDPHIYDWPSQGANQSNAELPLLDWQAGPVKEVRASILRELANIQTAVGDRLRIKTGYKVTSLAQTANGYLVASQTPTSNVESAEYDAVLLTFGFGTEPISAAQGFKAKATGATRVCASSYRYPGP